MGGGGTPNSPTPTAGAPATPSSGGSSGAPSVPDPVSPATFSYAACEEEAKVGEFRIDLAPDFPDAPQFTSITGSVADGVVPVHVPITQSEEGDCRLLVSPQFSCDPTCAGTETCGPDGCIPYPSAQSVGDVTIEGLLVAMTLSQSARNTYSNPASAMLPHPGVDAGSSVTLTATGDVVAGFSLLGVGIEPLAVPTTVPQVSPDQPVSVAWSAPASAGASRMVLALNLDNHGVSTARIECETDDDGSYDIPAPLVTELMGQGLSGFPSLTLRRQVADSTTLEPGCVQFSVVSELVMDVEVEGLVTCSSADDCPSEQECLPNLSCG